MSLMTKLEVNSGYSDQHHHSFPFISLLVSSKSVDSQEIVTTRKRGGSAGVEYSVTLSRLFFNLLLKGQNLFLTISFQNSFSEPIFQVLWLTQYRETPNPNTHYWLRASWSLRVNDHRAMWLFIRRHISKLITVPAQIFKLIPRYFELQHWASQTYL